MFAATENRCKALLPKN